MSSYILCGFILLPCDNFLSFSFITCFSYTDGCTCPTLNFSFNHFNSLSVKCLNSICVQTFYCARCRWSVYLTIAMTRFSRVGAISAYISRYMQPTYANSSKNGQNVYYHIYLRSHSQPLSIYLGSLQAIYFIWAQILLTNVPHSWKSPIFSMILNIRSILRRAHTYFEHWRFSKLCWWKI